MERNPSTFRLTKVTPLEEKIIANYWKKRKNKVTCIYDWDEHHKYYLFEETKRSADRKIIIVTRKLCHNYTSTNHCVADWKSKLKYQSYGGCHNSFICDKNSTLSTALALNENNAVYSDGLVQVNGVNYRALLDTGSGISYTLVGSSYALVISTERINKRPIRKVYSRTEMILHSTTKTTNIFQVKTCDLV